MKAVSLALIVVLLTMSSTALACTAAPVRITEARRAEIVFIGEATRLQTVEPNYELFVYVTPSETLKGRADESVRAQSPCSEPIELGQRVVVAAWRGKFYVYPAKDLEERFREAFRHGRR